jgi:hypothetical protein
VLRVYAASDERSGSVEPSRGLKAGKGDGLKELHAVAKARVTIDERVARAREGVGLYPMGAVHRLKNPARSCWS